ncbi:MAG: methyltransferase regulatory domain-containing protein [Moraxella sp.]|nr:methyltransferase regulatory domain-containing protein [Moraxella sp.]
MTQWSEGYVNDINYTYGYYEELNPERITLPFLMANIAPPTVKHACELGFGQGVSVNLHAMAGSATWHATDFNPSQAHFAEHLSRLSGAEHTRLHISDQGFSEFCAREDLPQFDFIALHGIWSWISDDNRHIITDFLRRKLNVGGVLYISYNTLPGWSAAAPIRHLLVQHNTIMATGAQNRANNAKQAVNFGKQVINLSHAMTSTTPTLKERIDTLETMSPNYLAHEYLNKDWHPMYFSQVADWLGNAKLSYACSTNYFDDFAPVLFDDEQQAFFNSIDNPILAQTIKDYLLNKQFRRDYWVKGVRKLSSSERDKHLLALTIMLVAPKDAVGDTISNHRATKILPELFAPVLDILADKKSHTIASLCQALTNQLTQAQLFSVIAVLYGKGDIVVCRTHLTDQEKHLSQRFNHAILNDTRPDQEISHLASPVTGGGIHFGYVERLFLWAHLHNHAPDTWVEVVWQLLKQHRQLLIKDNTTLTDEQDNLTELKRLQQDFVAHRFELAKRLMII